MMLLVVVSLISMVIARPVGTNGAKMIEAKFSQNKTAVKDFGTQYCQDSDYYCDSGDCCFYDPEKKWYCAKEDFGTCSMGYSTQYCPSTSPILCAPSWASQNVICCNTGYKCSVDNLSCVPQGSSQKSDGGYFGKVKLAKAPEGRLKWQPDVSSIQTEFLRQVAKDLHGGFFPYWAKDIRATTQYPATNCWVTGFPADVSTCINGYEDDCWDVQAALEQIGDMVYGNQTPALEPVNQQALEWCNDAENTSQSETHHYSETETKTFTVSLTRTMSETTEMDTEISMGFKLEGISAGTKITMKESITVSTSTTSTQTTTKTKNWADDMAVTIPPRSRVTSTCYIQAGKFSTPFEATIALKSPVVYSCATTQGPNWYVTPSDHADWSREGIVNVMSSYGFNANATRAVFTQNVAGVFTGLSGQKIVCSTHTEKLKKGESCPTQKRAVKQ